MTPAQNRAISFYLSKNQDDVENPITFAEYKKAQDQIDIGTASIIIRAFRDGIPQIAVNQIRHLLQ
jgi:hypothetical protein